MTVKVYSTHTCTWCIMAKDYLKSKDIAFEDIDVSRDQLGAMEMIRKSGQRGVPVLDIDGQIVVGFDQKRIDQLISK